MTAPFLAGLSRAARVAFPIIEGGVARGLSANAILDSLREQGLGVRRTVGLELIRRVRGIQEAGAQLRNVRRELRPDPVRLPEALTRIRRDFSFTVRARGVDRLTGERVDRFVTITTDELLTRGQLEETAAAFLAESPERYQLEQVDFLLVEGKRAGRAGTIF